MYIFDMAHQACYPHPQNHVNIYIHLFLIIFERYCIIIKTVTLTQLDGWSCISAASWGILGFVVEIESLALFSTFRRILLLNFTPIIVENPFSQRYVVEKDTNNFNAPLVSVGESCCCEIT